MPTNVYNYILIIAETLRMISNCFTTRAPLALVYAESILRAAHSVWAFN